MDYKEYTERRNKEEKEFIFKKLKKLKSGFLKTLKHANVKIIFNWDGLNAVLKIWGWEYNFEKYNRSFILVISQDISKVFYPDNYNPRDNKVNLYDYNTGCFLTDFSISYRGLKKMEDGENINNETIDKKLEKFYKNGVFSRSLSGSNWIDLNKFEYINGVKNEI
jgi:hypothetical protein